MPRILRTGPLVSVCVAVFTTVGLGAGWVAASASPEEEVSRLNRVRANLFEELVRTRAEATATSAELRAAKARDEHEIARLNRVRTNLFEDLVKARAEAAAVRKELDASSSARNAAEAALARLRQEAAARAPADQTPIQQSGTDPRGQVSDAGSAASQIKPMTHSPKSASQSNASAIAHTGASLGPNRNTARSGLSVARTPQQAMVKQDKSAPRKVKVTTSSTRSQELPNVLRLQSP